MKRREDTMEAFWQLEGVLPAFFGEKAVLITKALYHDTTPVARLGYFKDDNESLIHAICAALQFNVVEDASCHHLELPMLGFGVKEGAGCVSLEPASYYAEHPEEKKALWQQLLALKKSMVVTQ